MLKTCYFVSFFVPLLLTSLEAAPIDVYFGTGGDPAQGIYRGSFDPEKGTLSTIHLAAEIDRPGFLARHPSLPVLYSIGSRDQQPIVAAYAILEDGSLKPVNQVDSPGQGSCHIAVHPSGNFLLTAEYGAGTVTLYPLSEEGTVLDSTQVIRHEGGSGVVARRQDKPHPHWVGFSPDGRFAFVPDLGLDELVIYAVDTEENELRRHGSARTVPGGGPRHMTFSVDGRFIYLLNELSLSVTTFSYDADSGTAKRLGTTPTLTEEAKAGEDFTSASEILVHPNGQFIYSANRGHDSVTVYQADPESGRLTVVEVEPIRGAWPRNINLTRDGRWLLAAGARSNTVSVFRIDPKTGELQFPTSHVYPVPNVICIVPNDG